jgi:formylmethanofuran dehydrogenase subunit E
MTKRIKLLEQLIKSWAQDHCVAYTIADFEPSEEAMKTTQSHFTWVVREGHADIDLQILIDRLDMFMENYNKKSDGMWCVQCGTYCQLAESNREDGSFVCYSCIKNPYH